MKEVGLKFGRRLGVHPMQLMLDETADSEAVLSSESTADGPPATVLTDTINIASTVIESALASFQANKGWADRAVAQLPGEKLHVALDANTNSGGVIMKHVAGNLLSKISTERPT